MPRLLVDHPAFAGVRVDHVDGLADPLGYLEGLRATIGDRWLLVEKILAADETLPRSWPVDGHDGLRARHRAGARPARPRRAGRRCATHWVGITGDDRPFRAWELEARREVLDGGLRPDLERVAARRGWPTLAPVAELSVHLERYRTYLPDEEGRPALDAALEDAADGPPRPGVAARTARRRRSRRRASGAPAGSS